MRGEVRAGRREGVGRRRRKRHARGKARLKAVGGQGTRGAHVEHVYFMSVTLEVSKLSGWLKACAFCRVEREGHAMRGEVARREAGGHGAAAAQAACSGKARLKAVGGQGTHGAHVKHEAHGRDLGGVKAQRLVERVH